MHHLFLSIGHKLRDFMGIMHVIYATLPGGVWEMRDHRPRHKGGRRFALFSLAFGTNELGNRLACSESV